MFLYGVINSDGMQGVYTGMREPVLRMSGQTVNPFSLLFQTLDQGTGKKKTFAGPNLLLKNTMQKRPSVKILKLITGCKRAIV